MKEIDSIDAIRGLTDIQIVPLEVPEWEAIVYLRSFDAHAFSVFMSKYKQGSEFTMQDAASMAALCICDKNGNRLMANHEDLAKELMAHNPTVIQKIYMKAMEISGLTQGAVEQAEKK